MREALEANDWAQLDDLPMSDFGDFEDAEASPSSTGKKDDKDLDPESLDFGFDRADFEGLRKAIWTSGQLQDDGEAASTAKEDERMMGGVRATVARSGEDTEKTSGADTDEAKDKGTSGPVDDEIVKVERMMRKLQAVRDAGDGMGEEQRRRMAARAVEEVMREL